MFWIKFTKFYEFYELCNILFDLPLRPDQVARVWVGWGMGCGRFLIESQPKKNINCQKKLFLFDSLAFALWKIVTLSILFFVWISWSVCCGFGHVIMMSISHGYWEACIHRLAELFDEWINLMLRLLKNLKLCYEDSWWYFFYLCIFLLDCIL